MTDISLDVPDYENADPSESRPVDLLTGKLRLNLNYINIFVT